MNALIAFLIFVLIVAVIAYVIIYVVNYAISLIGIPVPAKLVQIIVGLIAFLLIVQRAMPLISVYT